MNKAKKARFNQILKSINETGDRMAAPTKTKIRAKVKPDSKQKPTPRRIGKGRVATIVGEPKELTLLQEVQLCLESNKSDGHKNSHAYMYAPNFFLNCFRRLEALEQKEMTFRDCGFSVADIPTLAKSKAFRNMFADYVKDGAFRIKPSFETTNINVDKLIPIFGIMFSDPRYLFITLKMVGDKLFAIWNDRTIEVNPTFRDMPVLPMIGYGDAVKTNRYAAFDTLMDSTFQEVFWRCAKMKHSFMDRNKQGDFTIQGTADKISKLEVGDRIIIPLSACARLSKKNRNHTLLSLERGAYVHSTKTERMKATDGKGDWTRRVEQVSDEHACDWLRTRAVWNITNICYKGGGTGHGRFDVYPDGLHVSAICPERKELIEFYVTGCFTCQIPAESIWIEKV